MTDFQGPRCETCKFFFIEVGPEGFCRRYPPQLVVLAVKPNPKGGVEDFITSHRFPLMLPSGWCGEHNEPGK